MKIIETPLKDAYIIEPTVRGDNRGFFLETYNQKKWNDLLPEYHWVQDNLSSSSKGTLRGLHLQKGEHAQAKLVRVSTGTVYDVIVDLRVDSPTFKKSFGVTLCSEKQNQLLVPRGFAHGFLVTSERAIFEYKCDNFYHPESEQGLHYACPTLAIDWPMNPEQFILSAKDKLLPDLKGYLAQ